MYDESFDVVLAFDLLEHLSPAAVEAAIGEMTRVSRDEVWLSCFNAVDAEAHGFREVDDYHWNTLGLREIAGRFDAAGFDVEIVSVADELEGRFRGYRHYNQEAHVVIGRRRETQIR